MVKKENYSRSLRALSTWLDQRRISLQPTMGSKLPGSTTQISISKPNLQVLKPTLSVQRHHSHRTDAENLGRSHLGALTTLPEFLPRHFFGDQSGSTGLDLLRRAGLILFIFWSSVFIVGSSFPASSALNARRNRLSAFAIKCR